MNGSVFSKAILRGVITLWILAAIFLLPWWIATVATVVALFYFTRYYEALLLALVLDLLYGVVDHGIGSLIFFLSAALLFLIVEQLKTRLVFYG